MHSGHYIGADQCDRATPSIEHGTVGEALAEISARVEQARTAAASQGSPLHSPLLLLGTMERVGSNWLSDTLRPIMGQHNEPLRQQLAPAHPLSALNPDLAGAAEPRSRLGPYGWHWLVTFAVSKYARERQAIKETNLFFTTRHLLALFPDAPVAVLTRSPLGVASSFTRGGLFSRWGYAARYRHLVAVTHRLPWAAWADLMPDDKPGDLVALVRLHALNTLLLANALDGRDVVTVAYEDAVTDRTAGWAELVELLPDLDGVPRPAAVASAPAGEDTFATTVNKTRLIADLNARAAEVVRETLAASLTVAARLVTEQVISPGALARASRWLSGDHLYELAPPVATTGTSRIRTAAESSPVAEPVSCPITWLPRGPLAWRNLLISNAEYAAFLNELAAAGLANQHDGAYLLVCEMPHERGGRLHCDPGTGRWTVSPGFEDHPAYWVTWIGAAVASAWLGGRLPLRAELVDATAGCAPSNVAYAVGDTVAVVEGGRGPAEVHHLVGNVQVWCSDGPDNGGAGCERWLFGAAWNTPGSREEVTRLRARILVGSSRGVGVRVVRDGGARPVAAEGLAAMLSGWLAVLGERGRTLRELDGRLVDALRSQADGGLRPHVGAGAGEPLLGEVGEPLGEALGGQVSEFHPLQAADRDRLGVVAVEGGDAAATPAHLERHVQDVGDLVVAHVQETARLDEQAGLLAHLAHERLGEGFARVDFAAGQGPGTPAVGVLVKQQNAVVLDEDASDTYLHSGNVPEEGSR